MNIDIADLQAMAAMSQRQLADHCLKTPDGDLFWLRLGWLGQEVKRRPTLSAALRASATEKDFAAARRLLRVFIERYAS